MRVVQKDVVRFAVTAGDASGPVLLEARVEPDRHGGWRARATLLAPALAEVTELPRIFRSADRSVALGKMVAWIRGRYRHARPLADRRATPAPS